MANMYISDAHLEEHDPNNLNQHLKVSWYEVIGEPEGIRGPKWTWRFSNLIFDISKNFCYIFLAVIVSPFSALCFGCTFACLAFEHVWCITPCIRVCGITCNATRKCTLLCANGIISPLSKSFGYFWSNITVKKQVLTDNNATPDKDDMFLV